MTEHGVQGDGSVERSFPSTGFLEDDNYAKPDLMAAGY